MGIPGPSPRLPSCFLCSDTFQMPGLPCTQSILSLVVCTLCHTGAPGAEFGAAGDWQPHTSQQGDAQACLESWPPPSAACTWPWLPQQHKSLGPQDPNPGLPRGQHLPKLHLEMGFLLPQNRNLTEGKKLLADTSLHLELLWKNWENIRAHASSQGLVEERAGGQRKGNHMEIHKGFKRKQVP